jgi:hypothetical protein
LRHLNLYPASGRFDFLPRARAHFDAANRDTLRDLSIRQKLGGTFTAADQSSLGQCLLRHFGALWQPSQIVESDDLMFYTKDIRETALWQTAGNWHLAALELWLAAARAVMARPCLDTLMSLT